MVAQAQAVTYQDDFQTYGPQANPAGWVDTSVGNPKPSADGLFKTWPDPTQGNKATNIVYGTRQSSGKPEGSNPRIGTFTSLTTRSFAGAGRFEYRGRILRTDSDSRIGLTFFSSYPEKDQYYLIGLWPQVATGRLTMQLFSFGAGSPAPATGGSLDSNVSLDRNSWYRFVIRVDDVQGVTRIKARFWLDGTQEPGSFQIDGVDADAKRLTSGRIGFWSAVKGDSYIDEILAKSPIDLTAPTVEFFESGLKLNDGAQFRRTVIPEIRVKDDTDPAPRYTARLGDSAYTSGTPITTEGTHIITVQAFDATGNRTDAQVSFLIDETPPKIAFTAPRNLDVLVSPVVHLTGTSDDAVSVTIGDTKALIDLSTLTFSADVALLEGRNTIVATAADRVGNTSTATIDLFLDTRAPELSVLSPGAQSCIDAASLQITGTARDARIKSVVVKGEGTSIPATLDPVSGNWTATVPVATEGTKSFSIEADDLVGHRSTATLSVVIDRTAPTIAVTEGGVAFTASAVNRAVSLFVSASDSPGSGVGMKIDSSLDASPYKSGTVIVSEGTHTLIVTATDCAGHPASRTVRFTIDTKPPTIDQLTPANDTRVGTIPSSIGGHTDGSTVEIAGGSKASTDSSGSFLLPATFVEGLNTFTLRATDAAGNVGELQYHVTVKTKAPPVEITENGTPIVSETLFNRAVTPAIRSTDSAATVTATSNGVTFTSGTTLTSDGAYTIKATATDDLGHGGVAETSFTIDRTPPVVKITSPQPGAAINADTVDVSGSAEDATDVSVNGYPATLAAGSFSVRGVPLDAGPNVIVATARDRAGNVGRDQIELGRMQPGPAIILLSPADNSLTNRPTAQVIGRVVTPANVSEVVITLTAGGSTQTVGSPTIDPTGRFTVSSVSLREGANVITATAKTVAGKTSSISANVRADFTPPALAILESSQTLSDESRFAERAVLSLRVTDNGATLDAQSSTLFVDGTRVTIPYTELKSGGHNVIATARDLAGNETRLERTFFIGNGGSPVSTCSVTGLDPASGSTIFSSVSKLVGRTSAPRVKVNNVLSDVVDGSFCSNVELSTEGDNAVTVSCLDSNGSTIGQPTVITLKRVTGEPSVTIASPEEGRVFTTDPVKGDTVTVTGTAAAGVVSVSVNGINAALSSSDPTIQRTFTATGVRLTEGINVLVAQAQNAALRIAIASRRVTLLKDLPAISFTSPIDGTTTGAASIDLSGTYARVEPSTISLNGQPSAAVGVSATGDSAGSFLIANAALNSGDNTLTITGRDAAGRAATATIHVSRVAGAPSIAINEPADNSFLGTGAGSSFTVRGTASAAEGASVSVNGVAATLLSDGTFTATIPFATSDTTPVIARVTEPGGAAAVDFVKVTRITRKFEVVGEPFPAISAVQVDPSVQVLVLFSSIVDRNSLNGGAFVVQSSNGSPVNGALHVDKEIVTFVPAILLTAGETYTIKVSTAVKDLAGNALDKAFSSSFTTAATASSTAPQLAAIPAVVCASSIEVAGSTTAGSQVRLDSGTLQLMTSADATGHFSFPYGISGQPGFHLIRIRSIASDGSLSPSADVCFRVECGGPQVVSAAYDRTANKLTIVFSKPVKASTIVVGQTGSVTLTTDDNQSITGTATVVAAIATITPSSDLKLQSFTLGVTTAVKDLDDAALAAPFTQRFAVDGDNTHTPGDGSGFVSGEVFDATTGRPLAAAIVSIEVPLNSFKISANAARVLPSPEGEGGRRSGRMRAQPSKNATLEQTSVLTSAITTTTDNKGRYTARVPEGAHTIRVSATDHTTVWRQIIVPAGAGVIPIDIRLARRGLTKTSDGTAITLDHGGDTTVTKQATLTIPAGGLEASRKITLTSVGAQSLAGLLPLGWSPLASAEIISPLPEGEGSGVRAPVRGTLTFIINAAEITTNNQTISAVRYDETRDEWSVINAIVNIGSDNKASINVTTTGAYALVYPDKAAGLASPTAAVTGAVLQGVADPCVSNTCPPLVAKDFKLDPPIVLPSGQTVANLKIDASGSIKFPSGTAVQSYVDEELHLSDGSLLLDPPFATDMLLYRDLAGTTAIADFNLAPSARAGEVQLQVGYDHIKIHPYPGRLDRGTLFGTEGGRVVGDDRISIDVPAGATTEPLHVRASSMTPTDLGGFRAEGYDVVGGFQLELSRVTQLTQDLDGDGKPDAVAPVELTQSARATFDVDATNISNSSQVIVAEVLDGTAYSRIFRLAALTSPLPAGEGSGVRGRFTTNAITSDFPLDGIVREGRYLVLLAKQPIAYATGILRLPGIPSGIHVNVAGQCTTTGVLCVSDVTRTSGIFNLPVPAAPFALNADHATTGAAKIYDQTTSPAPNAILKLGLLTLTPAPLELQSTSPAAGQKEVTLATNVTVTFKTSLDKSSVTADSIVVTDASTGQRVTGTIPTDSIVQTITWIPAAKLKSNGLYTVTVAPTIRGSNGAPFGRTYTFSFSTITQLINSQVNRDAIHITIPDPSGVSRIFGDPARGTINGALPSGWSALAVRRHNDFVTKFQGTANADGSFSFNAGDCSTSAKLSPRPAAGRGAGGEGSLAMSCSDALSTSDIIDLHILSADGILQSVLQLTPFVTPDGKGFLAPADKQTRFTSTDNITVIVPEGAFEQPMLVTVSKEDKTAFATVPNFDTELGFSGAVKLAFDGAAKKPLEVELPVGSADLSKGPFLLGYLGQSVRGPRVMIVDTLRPENGKFTTTLSGTAKAAKKSSAGVKPFDTLTNQDMKGYLLRVVRSGTYSVIDIHTPTGSGLGWGLMDVPQYALDLFFDKLTSLYESQFYLAEGRGRIAVPVLTGTPFTVSGVDVATGLESFSTAYNLPFGDPGPFPIASPEKNVNGPYPVFGSPFRVEIIDLQAREIDVKSARDFTLNLSSGGILSVTNTLGTTARVEVLDVANGSFADNNGINSAPLTVPADLNDRIILLVEEKNVDPSAPLSLVFNEPIFTGGDRVPEAIDSYLHAHLKLDQSSGSSTAPLFTEITRQARFEVDSGGRRVLILLPASLQRGGVFRLTLRSDLADLGGPGGTAGLKLGQGTKEVDGKLTPVGGGRDFSLQFATREPAGKISEFCLKQSSTESSGSVRDLALDGNLLFVSALEGGILVYDTANPAAMNDPSCGGGPLPISRVPGGVSQNWAISVDHHGRVFTTSLGSMFGALRSYRVEAFTANSLVDKAVGSTIVSWAPGASASLDLASGTILSDRAEAIPRKLRLLLQDDEQTFVDRAAFKTALNPTVVASFPDEQMEQYSLSVPIDPASPYALQRITVSNESLDMRWSADARPGAPAIITNILAGPSDKLRILKNRTTYGVVSLFGYGIGLFDLNAMESNDSPIPSAKPLQEQIVLTKGELTVPCLDTSGALCPPPPVCDQAAKAASGDRCPIQSLAFNPETVVEPLSANSSSFVVYGLESNKGLLDVEITPPTAANPSAGTAQRAPSGLVLSSRYFGPSGLTSVDHPRLEALKTLFVAQARRNPTARFTSVSPYHWHLDARYNPEGARGSAAGSSVDRGYALVAGNEYGLLVVETSGGEPTTTQYPLEDSQLVDVIWIPGGAYAVRVIPEKNLAAVVDGEGRVLLVDLSRIDERLDASGAPTTGLFPTAKRALSTAGTYGVGSDDPRIVWKSEPGMITGTLAPWIDPATGMLFAGELLQKKLKVLSALDPQLKVRVDLGDPKGLSDVSAIVPLGIQNPAAIQQQINTLPVCDPATPRCRDNASLGVFRLEVSLPGAMNESLTGTGDQLRFAIESERVQGAVTEQTPVGFPLAHLRRSRRGGDAELPGRTADQFYLRRIVPNDPALQKALRRQRGFNRFVSPWVIAIADPRASEKYLWSFPSGITTDEQKRQYKASLGCSNCERPRFLQGKTEADGIYELWTNGRLIAARPELSGGTNTIFSGGSYSYLGASLDGSRLTSRFQTVMADTVRPTDVLVAAQNPPVADGAIQETIFLHSGELETSAVDLVAGGRAGVDVTMDRTYRSRTLGGTIFGQGWDSSILKRLRALPTGDVELRDGGGEIWHFRKNLATGFFDSPKGLFLRLAANDRGWTLVDQQWRQANFDELGRIVSESDEFSKPNQPQTGNMIRYVYDASGRLSSVIDPVQRETNLSYWSDADTATVGAWPGLLREVSDWRNRKIGYSYDAARGVLTSVALPEVTGLSRPTVRYAYTLGATSYNDRLELSGDLSSITDPAGPTERVRFSYGSNAADRDRITRQDWGTGESALFTYTSPTVVSAKDALGQERAYTLSAQPNDSTSDRAHVLRLEELAVLTSSVAFGTLPAALTPGAVQVSPQSRVLTYKYENAAGKEGLASESMLAGVQTTTNEYKSVPGAAGFVLQSTATTPFGGAATTKNLSKTIAPMAALGIIKRTFEYQQGANRETFIQSVLANDRKIESPEPSRNNLATSANNSSLTTGSSFDEHGLLKTSATSGGTDGPGSASNVSVKYASETDSARHQRSLPLEIDRGNGVKTTFEYPDKDTTVETDERGVRTTTKFDSWRRPVDITVVRAGDPLQAHETFVYDASGRLKEHLRKQEGSGFVKTSFDYDVMGRRKSVTTDNIAVDGATTSVTTTSDTNLLTRVIKTTAPGGAVTTTELDPLGRVQKSVTDTGSSPIERRFAYDLGGNLVYQTDMLTAEAAAFDGHGRRIATLAADGTKSSTQFDAWHRPVKSDALDAAGKTTSSATVDYTDAGRLTKVTSDVTADGAGKRVTDFTWDGGGRTAGMATSGRASHSKFDIAGRLQNAQQGGGSAAGVTDKFEERSVTSHDGTIPQQMVKSEKGGSAYDLAMQFNALGDATTQKVGNLEWNQKFDEAGNVTEASEPSRPASKYEYDGRGAVKKETLEDGSSTNQHRYHASGAPSGYTDPTSEATNTTTDLIGRPVERTYADGTRELIEWEGVRVRSITDRQGRKQLFVYNTKGQMTDIQNSAAATLDHLDYDDAGRMIRWKNRDSAIEYGDPSRPDGGFDRDGNPLVTRQIRYKDGTGLNPSPTILDQYSQSHVWNEHHERVYFDMPAYPAFAATGWTRGIAQKYDAEGNVISIARVTAAGATEGEPLMTASYRNAGRPDARTVFTSATKSIDRRYGYDATSGLLARLDVGVNGMRIAGSASAHDGLQISDEQLLGISSDERHSRFRYDDRSRLDASVFGTSNPTAIPTAAATPGRADEQLTPADFRNGQERTPLLDPATSAVLTAGNVNTAAIDPPTLALSELSGGGHKIEKVQKGSSVALRSYTGSQVTSDGRFNYTWDEKGRLIRAAEKQTAAVVPRRRILYIYGGNDRLLGRRAEWTNVFSATGEVAEADWHLESRNEVLQSDGMPSEVTFVWDVISDRLLATFRTGASDNPAIDSNGGLLKQIIHGGLSYDDPIEVTTVDRTAIPLAGSTAPKIRLYPVFDEAGAGTLQVVVNRNAEIVARSITNDPYGANQLDMTGAAVDRIAVKATKDSAGALKSVEVTLHTTETLGQATVAAGTRLAAVDANGTVVRTASATPALATGDAFTVKWTLTPAEWTALVDPASTTNGTTTLTPSAISIAATKNLRAIAWALDAPILRAPDWATTSLSGVHSSTELPVEVRESLSSLSTFLASIPANGDKETRLYEVTALSLLGQPPSAETTIEDLLTATFQAQPFTEPLTGVNYVRARWFDASTGTWLSPDPLGYVDSSNLYAFAGGDPVNGRDPLGLADAGDAPWYTDLVAAVQESVSSEGQKSSAAVGAVYEVAKKWLDLPFTLTDKYKNAVARGVQRTESAEADALREDVGASLRHRDEDLANVAYGDVGGNVVIAPTLIALQGGAESVVLSTVARSGRVLRTAVNANGERRVISGSFREGGNRGLVWVDENAHMSKEAHAYQSGSYGARSNIRTQRGLAPSLLYDNPYSRTNIVRFDGLESQMLIDRKLSTFSTPKARKALLRQAEAIRQNPGYSLMYEVPTVSEKRRLQKLLASEQITSSSIRVRVVPRP